MPLGWPPARSAALIVGVPSASSVTRTSRFGGGQDGEALVRAAA